MVRVAPRLLLTLALALGAWVLVPGVAWAESPLERLDDPLEDIRTEAVGALIDGLPETRAAVIAAAKDASPAVRPLVALVLAADATEPSVQALLGLFARCDASEAVRIRNNVVADHEASTRILTFLESPEGLAARGGDTEAARHLEGLYSLVKRADIEQRFLARKSKTGGTGYYKGQYETLLDDRKLAAEILSYIAADEAYPMPGVYRTGPYVFLRPRPIEFWEIQDMATNGVAELGRPEDTGVKARMQRQALVWSRKALATRSRAVQGWRLSHEEQQELQEELMDEVQSYVGALVALYLVEPTPAHAKALRAFIDGERHPIYGPAHTRMFAGAISFYRSWRENICASVCIRAGWYRESIDWYQRALRSRYGRSTSYYNLACAYASWSRDPKDTDLTAEQLKSQALEYLKRSVDAGWSDLGWMQQDRDLDPIRDDVRYQRLVERIEVVLGLR